MGSEPLEPEETDEVINEIPFDESGSISQGGKAFHHILETSTVSRFELPLNFLSKVFRMRSRNSTELPFSFQTIMLWQSLRIIIK